MLSVIDLLEAETLTPEQAAWLLDRIWTGGSWMVGAGPGGAGKTTVMSALLAMMPAGEEIRLTNRDTGWESSPPGTALLSYELSPGWYDGYIWGDAVRKYMALGAAGRRLVSNLHADTLAQARGQIVDQCGADPAHFSALGTFIPVTVGGGFRASRRRVERIHYYDAAEGGWRLLSRDHRPSARERRIADFCAGLSRSGVRRVEDVREAWLHRPPP